MESPSQSKQQEEAPSYVDGAWVKGDYLKRRPESMGDDGTFDPDQPRGGRTDPEPLCHRPLIRELRGTHCELPVGSLLMVKAGRWPRWPAVLSPDPESGEHVMHGGDGGVQKYHVEFLGSPHTRSWASPKSTELYCAQSAKLSAVKASLKRSYVIAMEEAVRMMDEPCELRLQTCRFRPTNVQASTRARMQVDPRADTVVIGGFPFRSWRSMEEALAAARHPAPQVRSAAPSNPPRFVHSDGVPSGTGRTRRLVE